MATGAAWGMEMNCSKSAGPSTGLAELTKSLYSRRVSSHSNVLWVSATSVKGVETATASDTLKDSASSRTTSPQASQRVSTMRSSSSRGVSAVEPFRLTR